jgi:hypothetical protein
MPYTRATIVRAKVRKEILQTVGVLLEGSLNQSQVVSLLTTITTHHNTITISQINARDFGVIKVCVCTTDVRPGTDESLRRVEFGLELHDLS